METSGPAAAPQPESSVAFLLVQLGFHLARVFGDRLKPLGLEQRHAGMLIRLAENDGRSQQAIAELIGVNPTRMVFLTDELEKLGLVERRRNPADRRSHALYLTEAGTAMLARVREVIRAHDADITASLTGAEREQLAALLQHLARDQGLAGQALPGAPPHRPSRAESATMLPMRTTPPFRADHVGSLLRPASVLAARDDFAAGRITAQQLRAVEDEAIAGVVAMQQNAGLQSATDGEFRRASWHMDFIYQIGGVSKAPGNLAVRFHNPGGDIEFTPAALHVGSKIHMAKTIFEADFTYLKSLAGTSTAKLTIPSPNMVHYRGGPAAIDPAVYPDIEEFWSDLAAAYADEVARLAALGCTYLQFDDTSLAYLNDPAQRAEIAGRGEDAEHLHLRYIRQVNAALAAKPPGLAVTTHLCRGNFRSSWAASGGYDFVAEALFGELNVDGFFLEYDDERSGGFEPLRFVPRGKMVVLGLVTTKRGELEDPDTLKRRIDQASKFVPLDQLCLSPQCGFSSTVEGNVLSYEQEVAKLELIVKVAQDVWG